MGPGNVERLDANGFRCAQVLLDEQMGSRSRKLLFWQRNEGVAGWGCSGSSFRTTGSGVGDSQSTPEKV